MSFAVPVKVAFTVTASGNPATVETSPALVVQAAVVHLGLKGDPGQPGSLNPQMPVILAQTQEAATQALASAQASTAAAAQVMQALQNVGDIEAALAAINGGA